MTSKAYQIPESAVTWLSTGGTELLTMSSVITNSGRQGALHDFGTAAHAREHAWRAWVKILTTPVVGEVIEVYWKSSDGSHPDNDDGIGDIAVSSIDKLENLTPLGTIVIDEASTTPEFVASGFMNVVHRHGGPVFWNATANSLSTTATDHGFSLTPMPMQGQAA